MSKSRVIAWVWDDVSRCLQENYQGDKSRKIWKRVILKTRFEDNEFFENIANKKKTAKKSDDSKSIEEILKEIRSK